MRLAAHPAILRGPLRRCYRLGSLRAEPCFIGSHLCDPLDPARDKTVVCVDNLFYRGSMRNIGRAQSPEILVFVHHDVPRSSRISRAASIASYNLLSGLSVVAAGTISVTSGVP